MSGCATRMSWLCPVAPWLCLRIRVCPHLGSNLIQIVSRTSSTSHVSLSHVHVCCDTEEREREREEIIQTTVM